MGGNWGYAFSLSKEQVKEARPPGTFMLIEHENHDHIHLLPIPSRSPADPFNWPQWRKWAILLIMAVYCGATNFATSALSPALQTIQSQMHPRQSMSKLTHLIAVCVLLTGVSNIIWVPLANTYGRRPVLIVAMLISVLASAWCGLATSYDSLLAARIFQGFGFGPADSLASSVVGEIFFVHERGRAMAIYTVFLAGGSCVGGLAGGYIAGLQGYKYIFWISTAILGAILLLELLLVPETSFDRNAQFLREGAPINGSISEEKANVERIERASPEHTETFTFVQSLKIGVYYGHLLENFVAPWRTLVFPGLWVLMLQYGALLGGLVAISTVGPQFVSKPPYLWGINNGLINVGGLIGCVVGGIINYLILDRAMKRTAKKESHGLVEPETRLPFMFPALILATTGMWTFGFSAANPSKAGWLGLCFGYGMVGMGITQIPGVGFNYLIDAYRPLAADCFVMTTIARAVVSFAWTFFVSDWVDTAGAALPFGIFGMLMGIFSLLTIPLWLFGKRLRIATAGYLPLEDYEE